MKRTPTGNIDLMALLQKREPLVDELRLCVSEVNGGLVALRHPLLYIVPYSDQMAAYANALFTQKQIEVERSLKSKRFVRYIDLHEPPYRAQALLEVVSELPEEVAAQCFVNHLINTENVSQVKEDWLEIIECIGYESLQSLLNDFDADELEIYRGVCLKEGEELDLSPEGVGLSWSTNREIGEWFARREFAGNCSYALITMKIGAKHALGPFKTRESEVIVPPWEIVHGSITEEYL